jgi:hypothetical protein
MEACLNLPKERYAITSNTTVAPLRQPETIEDPLMAVLRSGARRLLSQAIEAEASLAEMAPWLPDRRECIVRHGHGQERLVQTGVGPVPVQQSNCATAAEARKHAGADPLHLGPAAALDPADPEPGCPAAHPLCAGSRWATSRVIGALLGREVPNLSPSVIVWLRDQWERTTCAGSSVNC